MALKRLLLFDIDGTLLRCGPQVRPLFVGALEQVFGAYSGLDGYDFGGKTDPRIVLDLVMAAGIDRASILPRLEEMRETYVERLEAGLDRERMCLLPGVVDLLVRLSARDDVLLGLLTGNWSQGAAVKLSRFDLGRFFSFGAFGDDAVDRRDLVPVAMRRATETSGMRFDPSNVLIIGDTVRDVDCAQAAGVPSLAVATGYTAADVLRAAGADWVFGNLEEAAVGFPGFQ